ncbi:MAG: hypothetical protein ACM3NE_09200 [Hyphomicrobiales bacterium]
MRAFILALGFASAFVMPTVAAPAADNAHIQQVAYRNYDRDSGRGRWGYGVDCRELRRACLYKDELGETGRGNCQRYRDMCR